MAKLITLEKKIDILIELMSSTDQKQNILNSVNSSGDYIPIVDRDGLPAKIEKNKLLQTVYSDIDQLKIDFSAILAKVSEIDKSVKEISEIKRTVNEIKIGMPQTFRSWIKTKAEFARNFISLMKFLFYLIVGLYIASSTFPALATIFRKFIGE